MSENRLFRIIYILLDKGRVTAAELAETFEVSVRTIYRDIDALSGAGIPIYAEVGRNGGISLMNHYVLNKAVFNEEEKKELLASLQSTLLLGAPIQKDTLTKISAIFHMDSDDWLEVDFSRWGNRTADADKFYQIKEAILSHKQLKIIYESSYQRRSSRMIQPLKLSFKSNAWYVKAYCTEKKDYRMFKCSRILEASLTDQLFTPTAYPAEQHNASDSLCTVKLRFSKQIAYRVYDEFDERQIEKQKNGDFIVHADLPKDAWLCGYLLSFGVDVEILEPMDLRTAVREQAKLIYEKYKL